MKYKMLLYKYKKILYFSPVLVMNFHFLSLLAVSHNKMWRSWSYWEKMEDGNALTGIS